MPDHITLTLGVILAAGVIANGLAGVLRIPKVTLYIVLGLLLGPSGRGLITAEEIDILEPIAQFALAVVMFELGSRFAIREFRKILRHAWPLSLGELAATFVAVTLGMALVGVLTGGKIPLGAALLFGVLALATAPATTILVLQEYDSEGPITDNAYTLVALNNLVAIVLFEIVFALVALQMGGGEVSLGANVGRLLFGLVSALALGIVGGFVVSFVASHLTDKKKRVLGIFAMITLMLGVCELPEPDLPYLLTFLVMGVTVANSTQMAKDVVVEMGTFGVVLYVVFFVTAGAHLNLQALTGAGFAGVAYIVLRCCGKYVGIWGSAKLRKDRPEIQQWLGLALLAQAGAAIGLVNAALGSVSTESALYPLVSNVHTVIIGTVVFFELVGPILTRFAVVRGGEVPLVHVVQPHTSSWAKTFRSVREQVRRSLGKDPWSRRDPNSLTVGDLMRRDVKGIDCAANFEKILDFIEHSRQQTYPVVDSENQLQGVIRYSSIRSALFDPEVANLVVAEDLSVTFHKSLVPDQPLDDALSLFESTHDDIIPVVESADSRKLVGLVERRDVVRVMKRRHGTPAEESAEDSDEGGAAGEADAEGEASSDEDASADGAE